MSVDHRVPHAALELLLSCGYDTTSVEELAEAAGVSRSTFFRRYGSKEDMVFADQDERLAAARAALVRHSDEGPGAVVHAALTVFDTQTADPELARLRWRLMHKVPALRDRELVSTHRFERLFRDHLLSDVPRPAEGEVPPRPDRRRVAAVALAAAVVSVHNDFLRSWLRSQGGDVRPALERALQGLVQRHGHEAAGTGPRATGSTVVVVTAAGGPHEVAAEVERALRERG
ncbi:TetR/AcrR family transcriptional regulator [Galactobacter valiniphilus]|uniref:TetR/AcrR family transcriptional regulator n=1 Tax=Galactobacter valiniphilus TaxID=2676122 RepID=UPI001314AEF0|nr:TetR/AcrR family transcriptional regulator [Galactobacter valiniphilus]